MWCISSKYAIFNQGQLRCNQVFSGGGPDVEIRLKSGISSGSSSGLLRLTAGAGVGVDDGANSLIRTSPRPFNSPCPFTLPLGLGIVFVLALPLMFDIEFGTVIAETLPLPLPLPGVPISAGASFGVLTPAFAPCGGTVAGAEDTELCLGGGAFAGLPEFVRVIPGVIIDGRGPMLGRA